MRLLLRPFLGQYDASRGQRTEFHMNTILPIASYTTGIGFPIQFAYRPKATPFAVEACEANRSLVRTLEGRLAEQFCHTVRSHLAIALYLQSNTEDNEDLEMRLMGKYVLVQSNYEALICSEIKLSSS